MALSRRWPEPEAAYRAWYADREISGFALGALQVVSVNDTLAVANMVAQAGTRPKKGRPPIRYEALERALAALAIEARDRGAGVHMPRIGCGLAGGEWSRVRVWAKASPKSQARLNAALIRKYVPNCQGRHKLRAWPMTGGVDGMVQALERHRDALEEGPATARDVVDDMLSPLGGERRD